MPRLIQFMHPGKEPGCSGATKPWNTGEHRRSFLKAPGAYRTGTAGSSAKSPALLFWGEWEAPADVHELGAGAAKALYVPRPPVFPRRAGLQNTDPYAFDGPFLYCCCKQVKKSGVVTYLRNLDPGDVLLFGSHSSGTFVLDTVFVVRDSLLYRPASGPKSLAGKVPPSFVEATLKPLAFSAKAGRRKRRPVTCGPNGSHRTGAAVCRSRRPAKLVEFRLYWGATPEAPVDGMFSFAPAATASVEVAAFPRPDLGRLAFIEERMTTGFRDCCVGDKVRSAWNQVAEIVLDDGLVLGTRFELPGPDESVSARAT